MLLWVNILWLMVSAQIYFANRLFLRSSTSLDSLCALESFNKIESHGNWFISSHPVYSVRYRDYYCQGRKSLYLSDAQRPVKCPGNHDNAREIIGVPSTPSLYPISFITQLEKFFFTAHSLEPKKDDNVILLNRHYREDFLG